MSFNEIILIILICVLVIALFVVCFAYAKYKKKVHTQAQNNQHTICSKLEVIGEMLVVSSNPSLTREQINEEQIKLVAKLYAHTTNTLEAQVKEEREREDKNKEIASKILDLLKGVKK